MWAAPLALSFRFPLFDALYLVAPYAFLFVRLGVILNGVLFLPVVFFLRWRSCLVVLLVVVDGVWLHAFVNAR